MIIDDYIGTVHIKTEKPGDVAGVFEKYATGVERAYVAPPRSGWTALYPREGDSSRRWAEIVSRELKATCIAFQVIEDEVFAYQIFCNGECRDEFASRPAYFFGESDEVPKSKIHALRGNPQAWEEFLVNGRECADVARLLVSGFDDPRAGGSAGNYVIPSTILEDLCSMVAIQGAGLTYDQIHDEIQEWEEDAEMADEDDEADEDLGLLSCGRHARELHHVRAPRRAQKTTSG